MASLLLAIVVGVWSFSFLGTENQEYPDFNNDTLWIVKEKKFPPPTPDFSTKEEALKIELAAVEVKRRRERKSIRSHSIRWPGSIWQQESGTMPKSTCRS